jgi:hypothetical protein
VVWCVFALSGTSLTASQEGPAARTEILIESNQDPSDITISANSLPEADIDDDGWLTLDELEAYADAHPDAVVLRVEPAVGDYPITRLRIEKTGVHPDSDRDVHRDVDVFVVGPPGELLQRHPEADLNGDGTLDPAEIEALDLGDEAEVVIEMRRDNAEDVVLKLDVRGPMSLGDRNLLLEEFPDADLDRDGKLSQEEFDVLIEALEENEGPVSKQLMKIRLSEDEAHEASQVVPEGHGSERDFVWIGEEDDPERRKRIIIRADVVGKENPADQNEDGVVSEEEAQAYAELQSEKRRQGFLKTHPEADADGDGVISEEEAEALAARLAEKANKKRQPE